MQRYVKTGTDRAGDWGLDSAFSSLGGGGCFRIGPRSDCDRSIGRCPFGGVEFGHENDDQFAEFFRVTRLTGFVSQTLAIHILLCTRVLDTRMV